MSAAWCAECEARGDYRVVHIEGDGGYGTRIERVLCAEHLAPLVRESTRRYEVTPISRRTTPPDRRANNSPGRCEVIAA